MAKKKEANSFKGEVSNNILVLILIVIIFVSILGTIIIKQSIDNTKISKQKVITNSAPAKATGYVGITIAQPQKEGGKGK